MYRKELPEGHGMLFDFHEDQPVQFWMEDYGKIATGRKNSRREYRGCRLIRAASGRSVTNWKKL
jgi:hypothetical protein